MNPGLKKKLLLSTFRQHRHNLARIHPLRYLFWEATLRCNLKCRHCGSDCRTSSFVPNMPLSDFLRVLDEISPSVNPNETMIVVTGGEPLLRKDLEEAGRAFISRGFPWGIVTNGLALNQKKLELLLDSGLHAITVSLDGLKEQHNLLRQHPASWDRAMEAIRLISEVKDLKSDVVSCVHQDNIGELEELKAMLIENGVRNWRLFTIFPKGRGAAEEYLRLKPEQFRQLMEFIAATRREGRIVASYGCEGFLGNWEMEVRDHPFFCQAGITIGSVLADGSISACPSIRDSFTQGNIYKDNFMDVWNMNFHRMRNRDWAKTGICKDCRMWKWCEGNGMHLRSEDEHDPLICHYQLLSSDSSVVQG